MSIKIRMAALNLARKIPHNSVADLLTSAAEIEKHILGGNALQVTPEDTSGSEPSPTADVLEDVVLSGSTLILKSRQVGMTNFLTSIVARESVKKKRVAFFAASYPLLKAAEELIKAQGGDATYIDTFVLNRVDYNTAFDGKSYDMVVVDGLAFLSYTSEDDFVNNVMPLCDHHVFATEPGQARGLFHDLWQGNTGELFQKVALSWCTPLYVVDPASRAEAMKIARKNLGDERFRNQYECQFREITDD